MRNSDPNKVLSMKQFKPADVLLGFLAALTAVVFSQSAAAQTKDKDAPPWIRSAKSGPWSAPATWEGGKVPAAPPSPDPHRPRRRLRCQLGQGHPLDPRGRHADLCPRQGHAARRRPDQDPGRRRRQRGRLRLRRPRLRGRPGQDRGPPSKSARPSQPHRRQAHRPDPPRLFRRRMDKESCPAIVCCGGRMDFHGAPLNRTWVKLGDTASKGDASVTLAEAGHRLEGRRSHHRHRPPAITTTSTAQGHRGTHHQGHRRHQDHARQSRSKYEHLGSGDLSRRGGQPEPQRRSSNRPTRNGVRGHTMYHRDSAGVDQLCRVPPSRQGRRAGPLQPALSTWSATPCAAVPSSAPRSGTAAIAG